MGDAKSGLLIFSSAKDAEDFVSEDPYVTEGLVIKSTIQQWNVVAGSTYKTIKLASKL